METPVERVGILYDDAMNQHRCGWDPDNPENPDRLSSCVSLCEEYGLLQRCVRVPALPVSRDRLLRIHAEDYEELVASTGIASLEEQKSFSSKYDGIYVNDSTYKAALLAAGGAVEMASAIANGDVNCGMALVRPPGHHALHKAACGYCFFNNVAVAARVLREELGLGRILVVDWDVHHGQATQREFYEDPSVLYFSVHRYEYGSFWPNLAESDSDFIGSGNGAGYNVNVPLNQTGCTDGDYLAIFHHLMLPMAEEFQPDMVLVSAGYDAALGCPEGEMDLSPAVFAHMTHHLRSLADGKLLVILEGGYCIKSLSESVAMTLRSMLGDPCPQLKACTPNERLIEAGPPYDIVGDYPVQEVSVRLALEGRLDRLRADTVLTVPANRTCLVYDRAMSRHSSVTYPAHPERPARTERMFACLQERGFSDLCRLLPARRAKDDELLLVHEQQYLDLMERLSGEPQEQLSQEERRFNSVYLCPASYDCALLAAGCTLNLVDEVLTGKSVNGAGVVRPPGHHAEAHTAMGFCFVNTVALAARYAQNAHHIDRVLIVDWDVHHGNGVQNIFESDPSVLYISIHRYDNGLFYPPGGAGSAAHVGRGAGTGFNLNIPFNDDAMGDAEYMAAFDKIIMPVAYEFSPQLVLVSAGFDAARGDPLGGYDVTPVCYAHLTHRLSALAGGRLILVLEGGYNLSSISQSMAECVAVLLGHTPPSLEYQEPFESAMVTLQEVANIQQKFWSSLEITEPEMKPKEAVKADQKRGAAADYHRDEQGEVRTDVGIEPGTPEQLQDVEGGQTADNTNQITAPAVTHDDAAVVDDVTPPPTASRGETPEASESIDDQGKGQADDGHSTTRCDVREDLGEGAASSDVTADAGATARDVEDVADSLAQLHVCGALPSAGEGMFTVVPLPWCEHLLGGVRPAPAAGLNHQDPCIDCGHVGETWVCLTCYTVACSRYVNEHMLMHGLASEHALVLSYTDLSVWCYPCNSYIHNPIFWEAKKAAYVSKFGPL